MASSTLPEEIDSLAVAIHNAVDLVPLSQVRERLQILEAWFGSIPQARASLSDSLVLELGCGQGDMTATTAGLAGASDLKILAVDPGPLDYGAPITLGEAQGRITKTLFGQRIQWIQADSMDLIAQLKRDGRIPDFVVLAHSLFYLPSEEYLGNLLVALRDLSASSDHKSTKLLLAEWGMRASHPSAEAHISAVKAQAEMRIPDGNIRTLFYPESLKSIAKETGWTQEKDAEWWVVPREDVDDGCWEVATARTIQKEGWRDESKELEEMERAASQERVRSMDVWCAVFQCA